MSEPTFDDLRVDIGSGQRQLSDFVKLTPAEFDRIATERGYVRLDGIDAEALREAAEQHRMTTAVLSGGPPYAAKETVMKAIDAVLDVLDGGQGWRPGDPCGSCGSTDTGMDPADGAHCRSCGRSDGDE